MINYNFQTNQFDDLKKDFLRGLGANSDVNLIENLDNSFLGDAYQTNIVNIFKKFYNEKLNNNPDSPFLSSLQDWFNENLSKSFDERFSIATVNSAGLSFASLLSFLLTPIAGIACAGVVTGASSIAESQAKRNIGNIGHLSSHFANKLDMATKKLIDDFSKEFGQSIQAPKDVDKDVSFFYRTLSYCSSATASVAEKIVSRFSLVTESVGFVLSSVVGSVVPVLPLVNYKLSKMSADTRQKRLGKVIKNLHESVDKIIQSAQDGNQENVQSNDESIDKLKKIFANFAKNLKESDSHGKIPSKEKANKDKPTNISKSISFGPWFLSKIRNAIKKSFTTRNDDLSQQSINFIATPENYRSYQKPKTDIPIVGDDSLSQISIRSDDSLSQILQNYNSISFENAGNGNPFSPIYPEGQSPEEINQKIKEIDQNYRNMQIQLQRFRDQKLLEDTCKNYKEINKHTSTISEITDQFSTKSCFLEIKSLNTSQVIQTSDAQIENKPSTSVTSAVRNERVVRTVAV